MKNLFWVFVLAMGLGFAGCASDPAHPAEKSAWQYRTFPINAITAADAQFQISRLERQGWTYVAVDSTSRTSQSALYLVRMRRPNP